MKTIHAIYQKGVFRPIEPVDLPELAEVQVEYRPKKKSRNARKEVDLSKYVGSIKSLPIDPLEYQKKIRAEWD